MTDESNKQEKPTKQGWTGKPCPKCKGTGESSCNEYGRRACIECGGTGEEYGDVE
jgi:hypothetical protein